MNFLRSLLFNIFTYVWTALCVIIILPLLFSPRSFSLKIAQVWSKNLMRAAKWIVGLDYEVRGQEHTFFDSGIIIACKHQSTWETIVFFSLFEDPAIVLKKSLLYIPLFGWVIKKLKMIPVERSKKGGIQGLKHMLRKAEEAVSLQRPLVIFPEGTRTALGAQKSYHSGVFTLYSYLKIPVVPVALNSGVFWGRQKFLKNPGKVALVFCHPLMPGLNRYDFMNRLKNSIESKTEQLLEEGLCEKRR